MIGPLFERQLTPAAKLRRWKVGPAVPTFRPSTHDAVELAWVDEGLCRYQVGGRTFDVLPGEAIVVPDGAEHLTEMVPGTVAGSMWICPRRLEEERLLDLTAVRRPDLIAAGRALLSAAEAGVDPMLAECAVEGLVGRLVRGRFRHPGVVDPRIRRAIGEIEARYGEPIDVEALARSARMSRYHFSRVFREQTGKSPYQFLIETRLDRAAAMLAAGTTNVTEAALAVGFLDLGRFGRSFKARLGRTPSAFLREHRTPKVGHESQGGRTTSRHS